MDRGAWRATYSPWGCEESNMTEQLTLSLIGALDLKESLESTSTTGLHFKQEKQKQNGISYMIFPRKPGPANNPGVQYLMEKEMVTHSSILVWRIPWTEEPGGL